MPDEIVALYIPCASPSEAKALAIWLIDLKLIGCANIFPTTLSIYPWEGHIKEEFEAILIIKTFRNVCDKVKQLIEERHSYSIPCLLEMNVSSINPKYHEWLRSNIFENSLTSDEKPPWD